MSRLIDALELKRSIACSSILEDGKMLEQIIDEQPTIEPERKWIPCKERLPEVGQVVLRTVKGFSWNCEKYISVDVGIYNTNDGSILAWMPLPEPYREEGGE